MMAVVSQMHYKPATPVSSEDILTAIEMICLDIIQDLSEDRVPELCFPRRSNWTELIFAETVGIDTESKDAPRTRVRFDKPRSVKKFATMLKVLNIVYQLVQENKFCTKRDIFYQYPDLYVSQASMDAVIDDIACMLRIPRWELHILATSKGLVAGDLQFKDSQGAFVDCGQASSGVQVPAHTKDLQNLVTQAQFVLVVEKDATFQKLMNNQFCDKMNPCILITGKGFPDNGTQLLLNRLWTEFKLPIFILVDADPHGLEIMAVYKYGSMRQAHENKHLAVPSIMWIGILPQDIHSLHIPQSALSALTARDRQKGLALKTRPYFKDNKSILSQIDHLLAFDKKAEIQCLDAISSSYLCDVYLPSRISELLGQ